MATSPNPVTLPPPPPGFIPEAQANAAPTPPPGFVPEQQGGSMLANQPAQPPRNPYLQGAEDVATGAGKGLLNTVSGVSTLLNKLPWVGQTLAPSQGIDAMHQISTPKNTAQKVGYYGEQAGEFLVPGMGEEAAGASAAKYLPFLGKYAPMAGRLALNTVGTGALNKLQGGNFKTGTAAGLGGGLIGEGVRAAAPKIAETALGVTNRMRGHGKTIGEAVLNETSGITPEAIGKQAGQRISQLTGQLESLATNAQTAASLNPALKVLDDAATVARSRNSAAMLSKVNALREQLSTDISTGQALASPGGAVHPRKLLDLKRGIGDLVSSWAPQEQKGLQPIVKRVYGALDGELDRTVPGAGALNQKISSLIPARVRTNIIANKAPFIQRIGGRVAAHTGALAGAGLGSALGYGQGGAEGAVIGGLAGLALPEALSSPTLQMSVARYGGSPLPFLKGAALQANRTKLPWTK